jgi:hypothetical protein
MAPQQRQGYLHSEGLQGRLQRPHGVGVAGEAVQQQSAEAGGWGGHWGRLVLRKKSEIAGN